MAATLSGPHGDARLGGSVTFTATYPKQPGSVPVRVQVMAYQGDRLVYAEACPAALGGESGPFTLGGPGTDWAANGGPAECRSLLWAWKNVKGQQTILWSVEGPTFTAGG